MIGVFDLAKAYGARTLFEGVSLKLVTGSRYGLVGANGAGKTTFLEVLSGDEPASDGSVSIQKGARLGVLRQDRFLRDEDRILDVAMEGDALVSSALRELAGGAVSAARLAELEDVVRIHDGYTLEARASAILEGLGIPVPSHREALGTLSGGYKLRVLLAQVLLGGPDVLLLDEPTNHLDILSIRWLEKFLAGYGGCAVVIPMTNDSSTTWRRTSSTWITAPSRSIRGTTRRSPARSGRSASARNRRSRARKR
jgi:ATPase subunit of ABC transporter with duplicated ATPase domains